MVISNCFNHLIQPDRGVPEGEAPHHELSESVASKVQDAIHKTSQS